MPLNKLENFIKNAEGRILYVNPNDLDSTDGIENQGNSLTKPFKTIQRALIESARFSYLRGDDNDLVEKTTILVFPGEHLIDNRPGYAIKEANGNAIAVAPGGSETNAQTELTLTLNSNFDLTQEDNILYKFNSINGGIIIPRGTSIVGLDLRKTKVRPKYVPNPTDLDAPNSAIFRITGACYFWQFTFFDGDESGLVYTDPRDFSINNRSKPTFSHHKLTCFEYADGVNIPGGYQLTDLDMYYSKVSNAFNRASGREIDQKFPASPGSFAKQRPEFEIVGAFAADPITITNIISGDGATPGTVVTVTTQTPHGLNSGTPIKIQNINVEDYNISTKVVQVISDTVFTYALPFVRSNLPAGQGAGLAPGAGAAVVIETDTVSGASPYIFNCSLRSVYGMNGMHADGSRADGFRSMVVAQFTAVSLQKDDRAFVKYNESNRQWSSGLNGSIKVTGDKLSSESSATNNANVFHLDSDAVYRDGWKTTHIKMSNDAVIQIVSVFAIGFHKHFECLSGGDASITNSNSNFGQFSLASDGFKKDAFNKDDKGFVTGVVTPRSVDAIDAEIEWVQFDGDFITSASDDQRIYLLGYSSLDIEPPAISQGYRVGARVGEKIYLRDPVGNEYFAEVLMTNETPTPLSNVCNGTDTSAKVYDGVTITTPASDTTGRQTIYNTVGGHNLLNGESIRVFSETGDLPEGLEEGKVYYVVNASKNSSRTDGIVLTGTQFQIASSKTNADAANPIYITSFLGEQIRVESRISDKKVGETGHPIQFDYVRGNWFVYVKSGSTLKTHLEGITGDSEISYFKRVEDGRSIDEKIYKLRYVVPKELENARDPVSGFILQDSNSNNVRSATDFTKTTISLTADPSNNITPGEYDFDRNPRFISTCTYSNPTNTIRFVAERDHDLKINDTVVIRNVTSSDNVTAKDNFGFNGSFKVKSTPDSKTFTTGDVDILDITHAPANASFDSNIRNKSIPTFSRNDAQENLYVYRVEVITPYIKDIQDGVFYLYVLNAGNSISQPSGTFGDIKYSQNITDLYPQLDRDNFEPNPPAAVSYAKRTPLGEVVTNDLKRSITRETADKFMTAYSYGNEITEVSSNVNPILTLSQDHGLSGITSFTSLSGGSGHNPGVYHNVRLINNNNQPPSNLEALNLVWDGATAEVNVDSNGVVDNVSITESGSGYTDGEILYFDTRQIGGTTGSANITVNTADITDSNSDYVQVTGIGTATGGYYKISATSNKRQITIVKNANDPQINAGEYVTVVGRVGAISNHTVSSTVNVFTSTKGVGLVAGNRVRLLNASDENLGDYLVTSATSITFTINTTENISSATQFMKHALSDNNASADNLGENIGTRLHTFYDNETLYTAQSIGVGDGQFRVQNPNGTSNKIEGRFPVGCYIQVNNEIMRVRSSSLTGTGSDEIQVIRGSMGTIIETHTTNTLIKKIKLAPIELRRPSILRASGHTFEYLGYGPGNYSTGLPQVQVKTLSENEEFLSQSQETACGTVLYTGMDSDGDFYIGNTKYSAQSGEQKTFDVPTPTITGEDPNRLSVVFDEIVVKERILVEGGKSKQILSQFDGPVTFTGDVRFAQTLVLNGVPDSLRTAGRVYIKSNSNPTACSGQGAQTAALRVEGGVAIGGKLFVCNDTDLNGTLNVQGLSEFQTGLVPASGGGSSIYYTIGLESWTNTHNAPILFTQALDDGTGAGNQPAWLQDYVTSVQGIPANATASLTTVATGGHAAFTNQNANGATLQAAIRNAVGGTNPSGAIANQQFTIVPTDGQTHSVSGTSYPVMGKLYVPTGLSAGQIDVVVVFHGTVSSGTIASAAEGSLNHFLNPNTLNLRDKIIFSAAYPQDHISSSNQYNLPGVGTETSTFLLGDNLAYARAAVGWVKDSLNGYIAGQGGSKTIGDVYLFGHSQGGKLVAKMNTLETGISGVVANAPGPIQLDQTCSADPGNTSCAKIAAIHGAPGGGSAANVYLGTSSLPFSEAYVANKIEIGDSDASTSLISGILPTVDAAGNGGMGVPLGSTTKAFAEAHIGRIMIGHYDGTANSGNQFITTRSGTLKLSGNKGTEDVEIFSDTIFHTTTQSTSKDSGAIIVEGGVGIEKNLNVGGNLDVDGGLDVDGDTTLDKTSIDGELTVVGSAKVDQITLNGNTVTATNFVGTASKANAVLIGAAMDAPGDEHPMCVVGTGINAGEYSKIYRDNQIRFKESTHELLVTGDVVAFVSDDRLKTNRVGLTNALDKVCSLNGFTYNFNENAATIGFDTETTHVGVSAQEVQKVLPEAVCPAPVGHDYITVKYEKIVPLLIEAIKELSDKVSSLEERLNN